MLFQIFCESGNHVGNTVLQVGAVSLVSSRNSSNAFNQKTPAAYQE